MKWAVVAVAVLVALGVGALLVTPSRHSTSLTVASSFASPPPHTDSTNPPATVATLMPPAGYASEACSVFRSADLFKRDPRNSGAVGTASRIMRLAAQADKGDDPLFGNLAGDAESLYVDVASLSGGSLGDKADTNMATDCNSLVEQGIIH